MNLCTRCGHARLLPCTEPEEIEENQIKRKFIPNGLNRIQIPNQLESNPSSEIQEAWDPCAACLGKLPLHKGPNNPSPHLVFPHHLHDFGCQLPPHYCDASPTELTPRGVVLSLVTTIGGVPGAGASPEDTHTIAQDWRKEATAASPFRRLPNPERPLVRTPRRPCSILN
jgi:hypothetical protein